MENDFPPLVQRAMAAARRLGFPLTREEAGPGGGPSASLPGTGRFLAMLAAGCSGRNALIGELGTGTGLGSAWMASAMPEGCALVTAELDPDRAAAAREVFADDPRVTVVTGDARTVIGSRGPYDLLFSDGGGGTDPVLVDWLRIGGRIVFDDVTPGRPVDGDPKREFMFRDPRLVPVEVALPTLRDSLLVGTRIRLFLDKGGRGAEGGERVGHDQEAGRELVEGRGPAAGRGRAGDAGRRAYHAAAGQDPLEVRRGHRMA